MNLSFENRTAPRDGAARCDPDAPHGRNDCCGRLDAFPWVRDADLTRLSPREREVLVGLGEFMTNADIAGRMHIAERTAKKHVANIFGKLRIGSRGEAAVIAVLREGELAAAVANGE
ncbi:helix-turn-helix transcriptional regulator [Streptomyces sp. NPDC001941]|uniref:helix-turn-helix domain-containing protein n=1 Tax=Streptomyces sp. NPDC001941 TaxID=3154659 RepID=UPI00331C04AC